MSFDINKYEFSDFALSQVDATDVNSLVIHFGNSWFHLHKQDATAIFKHLGDKQQAIAIAKHFKLTAEDLKDEWISVDDKLPKMLQSVLVSITNDCVDGLVCEAMHQFNGKFICATEILSKKMRPSVGVTHWMPLPQPAQSKE